MAAVPAAARHVVRLLALYPVHALQPPAVCMFGFLLLPCVHDTYVEWRVPLLKS